MSAEGTGPVPGDHADRIRWNAKYGADFAPPFRPHPLAVRALALDLPDGPVADLACGPSGAVLLAAAQGLRVTAVDVSEVALGLLDEEARRRGLAHLITLVHADLSAWVPEPRSYALVLATGYWDATVFASAAAAVTDGGLLVWEALTAEALRRHPDLPPEFCVGPGEPGLTSARRLHRHRPGRRSPPRPPPPPSPSAPSAGPGDDPWSLISRRDTISSSARDAG